MIMRGDLMPLGSQVYKLIDCYIMGNDEGSLEGLLKMGIITEWKNLVDERKEFKRL